MLELVGMVAALFAIIAVPVYLVVRKLPRAVDPTAHLAAGIADGAWWLAMANVDTPQGPASLVKIVRTSKGKRTHEIVIAKIMDNDPDWAQKMIDARAEADLRIATMND